MDELISINKKELSELEQYLLARIANISCKEIQKDITIKITSENLYKYLTDSNDLIDQDLTMSLGDYKHDILSHAKTVYPDNATGWSLILSVNRVHSVTREILSKTLSK